MKDLPIWFQEMGALDTLFGYDDRVPLLYKEEKSPTELDWLEEVSADFEGLDFDNTYVDNDQTMAEFRKLFIAGHGDQLFRYGINGPVFLRRPKFWDEIFGNFETKNRFPFVTLSHELVLALVYLTNTADQHDAWGETRPGSPESHNILPFDLTNKEDLKILLQAVETILKVQQGKMALDPTGQYLVGEVDRSEAIEFLAGVERLEWRVNEGFAKKLLDDPFGLAVDNAAYILGAIVFAGALSHQAGGLAGVIAVLRESAKISGSAWRILPRALAWAANNSLRLGAGATGIWALNAGVAELLVDGEYEASVNARVTDRVFEEHRQSLGLNLGTLWRGPTYGMRRGLRWLVPDAEEAVVGLAEPGVREDILFEDQRLSDEIKEAMRLAVEALIFEGGGLKAGPTAVFVDLQRPVGLGSEDLDIAEHFSSRDVVALRRYFATHPRQAGISGKKFALFQIQYLAARLHFIDLDLNDWVREIFNQDGTLKPSQADKLLQTLSPKTAHTLQRITRLRQAKPKQLGRPTHSMRIPLPLLQRRSARVSTQSIESNRQTRLTTISKSRPTQLLRISQAPVSHRLTSARISRAPRLARLPQLNRVRMAVR